MCEMRGVCLEIDMAILGKGGVCVCVCEGREGGH